MVVAMVAESSSEAYAVEGVARLSALCGASSRT